MAPCRRPSTTDERRERLRKIATEIRRSVVEMIGRARAGHIGGDLSATDILATLFFAVLRVDPQAPREPKRDRFILSKGHCAAALYSTLALRGFFPIQRPCDVHAAALGAERPSEPAEGAGRRGEHRAARPRSSDRRRKRDRLEAFRRELANLRRPRRRRASGRLQLGSRDVRRPSPARHSDRDRRPQPPAAGRAHRGHQSPRAARRQVARLRLGRRRMRRPRPPGALRRLHRSAIRQAASASSPTRSRARASPSSRIASSGTTRCRPPSRSNSRSRNSPDERVWQPPRSKRSIAVRPSPRR